MTSLRPVLFMNAILLLILGGFMLVPAIVDLWVGNRDWEVFAMSAAICGFTGGTFLLTFGPMPKSLSIRQGFMFTVSSWMILASFAAVPFMLADIGMPVVDALFEAMSGITTTGSTVISGLDDLPPGLLLWRSILNWLGGVGIVVMAITLLPNLGVGGMQLFHMENSDQTGKVLPRVAQITTVITIIYVTLTAICAMILKGLGLSTFDAIAHAMTTVATGGFSTHDASIGHFQSPAVHWVITGFMMLGALPFLLFFQAIRGKPLAFWNDGQVRFFFAILLGLIGIVTAWRLIIVDVDGSIPFELALREAAFNLTSIMTGTGYATTDYSTWGNFVITLVLFTKLIGGCAGSTSCGIKIFRFQVLVATIRSELAKFLMPHGVFIPKYAGKPLSSEVIDAVLVFFFTFAGGFAVLALILIGLDLDFLTAVSGAATILANVGPGLGDTIGPAGNFQPLPDTAKWVMTAGMLMGRLELLTVMVLFLPRFWRS